jgi:FkbM family methyltransferase
MFSRVQLKILNYIRLHRKNAVVKEFTRIASNVVQASENMSYDITTNGEALVLRQIAESTKGRPPVLFDVGANLGDWSREALTAIPDAKIYAFELVPSTASRLRKAFQNDARVTVNEFGLSDCAGVVDVTTFGNDSTLSSLYDLTHEGLGKDTQRATVTTGDEYMATHGIDAIELLKLDVEGAEWSVLRGFEKALRSGAIRAIQFEYGRANIVTRHLLFDFYRLFDELGYRIGKIYPDGVDFRPYRWEHEDFRGPNFLAVRR